MSCQSGPEKDTARRFYGKYRGKVIENFDPLFQGRIFADVPAIPGSLTNWAMPCVPYAGFQVGFYAIPPLGANVWIEFEGGDPGYPIWAGCFWGPEDILLVPEPVVPEMKVFKTEFTTMIINDLPEVGGFSLTCLPAAVAIPLTMTFNSEGITIICPESTISMTPVSITLSVPESTVEVTPASISLTVPESSVLVTPEVITIAVPPSALTMGPEAVTLDSELVAVVAETNIGPLLTVEGETNLLGALTVEGGVDFAGVLAVEGAVDFAGALDVEGAVAIEGGLVIAGGGTIDGAPII